MQYPLKIVSLDYRNRSEKIFTKGGIRDLSVKSSQPRCYLHNLSHYKLLVEPVS